MYQYVKVLGRKLEICHFLCLVVFTVNLNHVGFRFTQIELWTGRTVKTPQSFEPGNFSKSYSDVFFFFFFFPLFITIGKIKVGFVLRGLAKTRVPEVFPLCLWWVNQNVLLNLNILLQQSISSLSKRNWCMILKVIGAGARGKGASCLPSN